MGDRGKILLGLAIFVILVTFPFWGRLAASGDAQVDRPELEYPADATACVEDTPYMIANHMDLLNSWRDAVVRDGALDYAATSGESYLMSLTETCLDCHSDPDMEMERGERTISVFVDEEVLRGSIHADVECVFCHESADVLCRRTAVGGEPLPGFAGAPIHVLEITPRSPRRSGANRPALAQPRQQDVVAQHIDGIRVRIPHEGL